MGSDGDYCAFTKAVENLGDRWSLLIVGHLERSGPLGFNALTATLPGISRSVLAERLRKLEELGLVARDPAPRGRVPGYCVTPSGAQLKPVFSALRSWALKWVPEDPALAERDPDLIIWWLTDRLDSTALPARQVVIDIDIRGSRAKRSWIVLEPGVGPSVCIEDPGLAGERYVYVEADVAGIYPIASGLRGWRQAIEDGSVELFGEPDLICALPSWFLPAEPSPRAAAPAAGVARGGPAVVPSAIPAHQQRSAGDGVDVDMAVAERTGGPGEEASVANQPVALI